MEFLTTKELLQDNAQRYGEKIAFKMRNGGGYRTITFGQTAEMAAKLQAAMAKLGIVPGDRVALISENRPEWPISYLAITAMGAVAVPLDANLRREEMLPLIEDCQPKLMFSTQP